MKKYLGHGLLVLAAAFVVVSGATVLVVNASYDQPEIAAPSNPASGFNRVYMDSVTHKWTCLTSSGGSCAPSGGGGGGGIVPTQVQSVSAGRNPSTVTFASSVVAADIIIFGLGWENGGSTPSTLTDNLGTSYTKVVEQLGGGNQGCSIFVGAAGGSGTLTATPGFPAGFSGIYGSEFNQTSLTTTADGTGSGQISLPIVTLTSATDGDLIWWNAQGVSSGGSFVSPAGFVLVGQSNGAAFYVQGKAGKILLTAISSTNGDNAFCGVALKHP